MLSKTVRRSLSQNLNLKSTMMRLLNKDETDSLHYQRSTQESQKPLREYQAKKLVEREAVCELTRLENGIRVMTLSENVPNVVDMGILMDMGSRDETIETSGSMLALKNTFLKTALRTNETVNYGMVQMSGGSVEMDYDQENTYLKANCMSHDVVDITSMLLDCALEPKTSVSADLAQYKNQESHNHENRRPTGQAFSNTLFQTAYGLKGLGMPLNGLPNHYNNLNASLLQSFQIQNIRPSQIVVGAAGVWNHQEFAELVSYKLSSLPLIEGEVSVSKRDKTIYVGGEARLLNSSNTLDLALSFQTGSWSSGQHVINKLLQTLVGNSSVNRRSRSLNNIVLKQNVADKVWAQSSIFSDSGLFTIQAQGPADKGQKILDAIVNELKQISSGLTEQELNIAKVQLVNDVLLAMESQTDRLEEATKNVKVLGDNHTNQYVDMINAVKVADIKTHVAQLLKGAPTLVLQGSMANQVHSYDKLVNSLKL